MIAWAILQIQFVKVKNVLTGSRESRCLIVQGYFCKIIDAVERKIMLFNHIH